MITFEEKWRELWARHLALVSFCLDQGMFDKKEFDRRRVQMLAVIDQMAAEAKEKAWKEHPGKVLVDSILGHMY